MKRILFSLGILFYLSIALQPSCNVINRTEVEFTSTNFGEEIESIGNLVFRFNLDVAQPELVNIWTDVAYLKFDPPLEGKFKWSASNELVFSPSGELSPCKNFTISMTDELFKIQKDRKLKAGKNKEINFATPFLKIIDWSCQWDRDPISGKAIIKALVSFNYPVDINTLGENLLFSVDGTKQAVEIKENSDPKNLECILVNKSAEDKSFDVQIQTKKGLLSKIKGCGVVEEQTLNNNLSSPLVIEIIDLVASYNSNQSSVLVTTSQAILEDNLSKAYSISPSVSTKAKVVSGGFEIEGSFLVDVNYTITINKNLQGMLGGKLKASYSQNVFFGERPPRIAFVHQQAAILTSKGSKQIAMNIVNVEKVNVKIYKIFENNILPFEERFGSNMFASTNSENTDEEDEYYWDYYYYDRYFSDPNNVYSQAIVEREFAVKDLPTNGNEVYINMDFVNDPKYKGIYYIEVSSTESYYLKAKKIVSVSDLGMMARQSENEFFVVVNSVLDASPQSGVEVSLMSTNNQLLKTIKTDNDGLAVFKDLDKFMSGFKVGLITARKGEDYNYMMLNHNRVNTSQYDVSGITSNQSGWWMFINPQRNLYRPGETIYFNSLLRTTNWKPIENMDLVAKLIMPNGKTAISKKITTNTQGAAESFFDISSSAITGFYHIRITDLNENLLASESISVEEFVPDKIRLNQTLNTEEVVPGKEIIYTAEAMNLFGTPAGNRKFESEIVFSKKYFSPKGFERYNFSVQSSINTENVFESGETNEEGIFILKQTIPVSWKNTGVMEGKIFSTVFDETGRPLNRVKSFDISTQNTYCGIQNDAYYFTTNQPATFNIAAVNYKGVAQNNVKVKVEVVKIEWHSVVEKYGGSFRYKSAKKERILSSSSIKISNGKAGYTYTPRISGEFEVRVYAPGSTNYVASSFYSYGWGSSQETSFEVSTDGEILIETDKESYKVGETAKLLFKTPFKGRLMVTIERDKVFEYHFIETDKQSAEYSFKLNEEHLPNVFVTATLIRELVGMNIPLTVAHGYRNITVDSKDGKIPLEIIAANESRSKTKQKIKIKTKPNAELTIAVVDEGILQIKNFQTPDPYKFYYQKRALEVKGFDMYDKIFPETGLSKNMLTGGGMGDSRRSNPYENKRIKPVSFWSGIMKANSKGEAEFEIDIPAYYGEVRIMVSAYHNNGFAAAEKPMKVLDPIIMALSLPRFLSPGDELDVTLNVINTSKKDANIKAVLKTQSPLELTSSATSEVSIKAGKEARPEFSIKVGDKAGIAKVFVEVTGLGEKFTDEIEIAVRPTVGFVKNLIGGVIRNGETKKITPEFKLQEGLAKYSLEINNSPFTAISGHLRSLLVYPHGCAEQVVSKVFPQLYLQDIIVEEGIRTFISNGEEISLNPNNNVKEALRVLQQYQTHSGGLAFWQNGYEANNWVSTYALHFIVEAEKAGFAVEKDFKSKLLDYVYATGSKSGTYEVRNSEGVIKEYFNRDKLYALYVSALAGKPNRSVMNYCNMNKLKLTAECKSWLALTFGVTGDKRTFNNLLSSEVNTLEYNEMGGSIGSVLRDNALLLNGLVDIDPNSPMLLKLSYYIAESIQASSKPTTQEVSFITLAFGKLHKNANNNNKLKVDVVSNEEIIGSYLGKKLKLEGKKLSGGNLELRSKDKGVAYYFYNSEGIISEGKVPEKDEVLRARKTFYTRDGKIADLNNIEQGQLLVVKINITATASSSYSAIENVVVTDMLPSCFEIENPRLTETRAMEWIKDSRYADNIDPRDDRINYYLDIYPRQTYNFYYMVRVTNKGTFKFGPVSADAMYNNNMYSYNGAGVVKVR